MKAGFDEFWKAYPRKIAKVRAQKTWDKVVKDPQLVGTILKAIEKQKKSRQWQLEGGRFIPHPATWLSDGRWEDELEIAVQLPKNATIDQGGFCQWCPKEGQYPRHQGSGLRLCPDCVEEATGGHA